MSMKKMSIWFIFFPVALIMGQPEHTGELIIYLTDTKQTWDVTFVIDGVSTRWDINHNLTTNYDGGSYNRTNPYNITYFDLFDSNSGSITMVLGKYRISIEDPSKGTMAYFYIDYRTSDLPKDLVSPDVYLDYSVGKDEFYLHGSSSSINGTTQNIWDLIPEIDHITTDLEPYPPENISVTSSGGNPYISWQHSSPSNDYITGYNVYRSINTQGGGPGNFNLITSTNSSTTNFTDEDLATGSPWAVYYIIKAVNTPKLSVASETVNINCSGFIKESTGMKYDYSLGQNYPNPFNSFTNISYSLQYITHTNITIYDILGNEVLVLLNKVQSEGNYQIDIDASGLPGGIYFYKITAGRFSDTKKFVLLK